jgi:protease I
VTRALILVERGFQDEEFVYPYYRMLEEGWQVDVATPTGADVHGKYGVPARATLKIGAARLYDVVVIPGGFESPDRLRMMESVQEVVNRHDEPGKFLAAICHGPWVLISAGVLKGRRVTGYDSIAHDLRNAGAYYTGESVTVDRNLITARHYRDNGYFMKALIAAVTSRESRQFEEATHAL